MPFTGFSEMVPLAGYTTFRLGGPAALLAEVSTTEDAVRAVEKARETGVKWRVIGHGSNILPVDSKINTAIIVFRSDAPPDIRPDGTVKVSGGYPLSALVDCLAYKGLGGLERLAGIPGTIGGAVTGNAGAYGTTIGEHVVSATILDRDGNVREISAEEFSFAYRHSRIRETGEAVLDVTFKTVPDDAHSLRATLVGKLIDRRIKHPDPMFTATAGSFFRNPEDANGNRTAAGRMLEEAGCKELRVGNAHPWQKHANIIVTEGIAKASDVKKLAAEMASRVKTKFGVELTPEVSYLE